MSKRGVLMALTAGALAIGCVGLGLALALAGPRTTSTAKPQADARTPAGPVVLDAGEAPVRGNGHPGPASSAPAAEDLPPDRRPSPASVARLAAARSAGSSFVAALLRYEAGEDSQAVRRAVRGTAVPALARRVLSAPPRSTLGARRAPRGRIVSLSVLSAEPASVELSSTVLRGDRRSGLLLELRPTQAGWKVSTLR